MAKETVKVDNGLEEVKLVSREEMENKKDKKGKKEKNDEKVKETKNKKENKAKKEKKEKKPGYFKQVRNEMKLVTWPSKKAIIKYSLATIFMIIVLAAFFIGISALFDLLYSLVQGWIG